MCDDPVPHHIYENSKDHSGWCDMKEGEGGRVNIGVTNCDIPDLIDGFLYLLQHNTPNLRCLKQ